MKDTLNTNNKILPLFRVPVNSNPASFTNEVRKGATAASNANLEQTNLKSISLNQILDLYSKGMGLYKNNLNNYLTTHNKLVASLILQLALRSVRPEANKEYELNVRISNFNYTLANLRISKLNLNNSLINELIKQGNEIINDLDYQITLQKNIITNIKSAKIANTINSLSTQPTVKAEANNSLNAIQMRMQVEQNLLINRIFKSINKSNEIKIVNTINSIVKNKEFNISEATSAISLSSVNAAKNNIQSITSANGIFLNYHNIIGYNFNKLNNKLIKNIYSLLVATFKSMYCLISKPVFIITPDKIIIQLFYYLFIPTILKLKKIHRYGYRRRNNLSNLTWIKRRRNITTLYRKLRKIKVNVRIKLRKLSNYPLIKIYPNRFKKLCEILSNLLHKPVELDLIRLHYPYNDSTILVNLLGIMINKIKLRIIIRRLFEKAVLKNLNKVTTAAAQPSAFLSGINIKVAGRLLTHKVVPRQTVKITKRGASAKGKINFSDVARFTNKNKRGAFSITITSGQNYL